MIVKWANGGKMLVNDDEMLVNDGEMSEWAYTHFTVISPLPCWCTNKFVDLWLICWSIIGREYQF